jgi:hypothetical protein
MELSKGLSASFFESLTAKGRQTTTPQFEKFVAAIRRGHDTCVGSGFGTNAQIRRAMYR